MMIGADGGTERFCCALRGRKLERGWWCWREVRSPQRARFATPHLVAADWRGVSKMFLAIG